ncbi:MAG: tetratricopeptide repeat protein [Thermoplasmatota archaeon]
MSEDLFFKALEDEDIRKADSILQKMSSDLPRTRQLYLEGLLLEASGQLEEALKKLNMALVLHLSDPALWLAKSKVLKEMGRMDMAKRAVDRACRLSNNDPAACLLYADILYRMKDLRGALVRVDEALELAPKDPEALTLKGILVSSMDEDYRKALTFFDSAIDSDDEYAPAWTNRGIVLRQIGDKDGSIYSFQKALMLDPDDRVSKEMLKHMGAERYIVKKKEGKKRKWSRSRYITDDIGRSRGTRHSEGSRASEGEDDDTLMWDEEEEGSGDIDELEEIEEDEEPDEGWDDDEDGIFDELDELEEEEKKPRSKKKVSDPDLIEKLKKKKKQKGAAEDGYVRSGRDLDLSCPRCGEEFTVTVKGITKFKCPNCGLSGEVQ